MLALKNRLKKKKDFEKLFKEGKSCKEGSLYLKFANNGLEESRFGFIVGKKFSGKAVARNNAKRKLREAVRKCLEEIKIGFDVAIIVLPGFNPENFTEVEKNVKKLLQRSRLTK